ncbi:gamma-glutamyl-gamma-aminobutyrate hydrolase family protein, partial [Candidatus Saccharibacteria bacterium]|nr:gamma-glutamyl-gamma-aminobutyrate hydrolase family protein [Candidatus Saccharibacteria bacterium]NIV71489.1 gamma-glutamyl-gamma-aminobutyrate hydrolase family protein [Calditrichia bacterium]NIV98043.1 gamma-glutamyl-gamma-aminobutyrate hydrolase family protein [Candidatus Saccharibacteria bacterium]NIW78341.1 gamma-glutamyl-gamma-aminobutyrate hydrolase family protein [Calditrichia bacterium]
MDVTLKKRKPVVGITGPNRGGVIAWFFTQRAVRKAGGKPIRITPANPCSIDLLDALIVGGGADLDPTLYGKTKTDLFPDIKDEEKTVRGKLIFLVSLIFYPFLYLLRKAFSLKSATLIDKARDQLEYKLLDDAF